MVDYTRIVRNRCWEGVNKKGVESYKKSLEEELTELELIPFYADRTFVVEAAKKEIMTLLRDEIKMCDFWLEYKERSKEDGFNTWKLKKKEDYPHKDVEGVERSNGKVKFFLWTEEIKMSRACLMVGNDSKHLKFVEGYTLIKTTPYVGKNKIQEKVEELMEYSKKYEATVQFPRYCVIKRSYEEMEKLLHIGV